MLALNSSALWSKFFNFKQNQNLKSQLETHHIKNKANIKGNELKSWN